MAALEQRSGKAADYTREASYMREATATMWAGASARDTKLGAIAYRRRWQRARLLQRQGSACLRQDFF
jgi:hypothetical protein